MTTPLSSVSIPFRLLRSLSELFNPFQIPLVERFWYLSQLLIPRLWFLKTPSHSFSSILSVFSAPFESPLVPSSPFEAFPIMYASCQSLIQPLQSVPVPLFCSLQPPSLDFPPDHFSPSRKAGHEMFPCPLVPCGVLNHLYLLSDPYSALSVPFNSLSLVPFGSFPYAALLVPLSPLSLVPFQSSIPPVRPLFSPFSPF